MKKYTLISLLSVFALALAGCQTTGSGSGRTITMPQYTKIDPKAMPAPLKAVSAAVTQRLRGVDAKKIEKSLAVKGSDLIKSPPESPLKTFALRHIQMVSLDTPKTPDGDTRYTGRLLFEDAIGRREGIAFSVDFRASAKSITLTKAAWSPLSSIQPKVDMLVVPAAAIADKLKKAATSYQGLYKLAVENAVAMRDRSKTQEGKKDYVIFTFLKDHVSKGSKFDVRLANRQGGVEGYKKISKYLVYDNGWVVGVTAAHFSLGSAFWIKAVYTPAPNSGLKDLNERVVGLYFSRPEIAKN